MALTVGDCLHPGALYLYNRFEGISFRFAPVGIGCYSFVE
jgi:hypothetical protein